MAPVLARWARLFEWMAPWAGIREFVAEFPGFVVEHSHNLARPEWNSHTGNASESGGVKACLRSRRV
jgi:hypothetical protein